MTDIAVLAPEVDSALVGLTKEDVLPTERDALAAVQEARAAASAELRAEAERRAAAAAGATGEATGDEVAPLLHQLADQLDAQRSASGVDRLVHELVTDLLADALRVPVEERTAFLTARAIALRVVARHAPLWPGAGPRLGCSYGYESVLAVVRRSAQATGA